MRSADNVAIIAAAGSGKTQTLINRVLGRPHERALMLTYTLQNQLQIEQRLHQTVSGVPSHARVAGWMSFLLSDGIRPYQHAVLNVIDRVRGLNFEGTPHEYTKRSTPAYYVNRGGDAYGRNLADFACVANEKSGGEVIRRLEAIYDHIYIDEVQDLAGYDLDFLDLLFASDIAITLVGDPRQCLLATTRAPKNKKYRGEGLLTWLDERADVCTREDQPESRRCHQDICDFASALFPTYPAIVSKNDEPVEQPRRYSKSVRWTSTNTSTSTGHGCCATTSAPTRWATRRSTWARPRAAPSTTSSSSRPGRCASTCATATLRHSNRASTSMSPSAALAIASPSSCSGRRPSDDTVVLCAARSLSSGILGALTAAMDDREQPVRVLPRASRTIAMRDKQRR